MREYCSNIVMIAVTLAWLIPFYQIVTQGYVYAEEPNLVVLYSKIALFVAIIALGIFNIYKLLRR